MQEILQDEVDTFFSELPFLSPTPELDGETLNEKNDDEDDQEEDDKLMEWVDLQVSRGFDDAAIDDALCCTSLNYELAEKVLSTLAAGNPIPDDIPGVWTAKDDEALQAPDSRDVMRVIQKHGGTSYEDRWTYLSEARERDMI